jgi:hypothetical protein
LIRLSRDSSDSQECTDDIFSRLSPLRQYRESTFAVRLEYFPQQFDLADLELARGSRYPLYWNGAVSLWEAAIIYGGYAPNSGCSLSPTQSATTESRFKNT